MNYLVIYEMEKDGGYSVHMPDVRGCISQGATFEKAGANIKEALEAIIESLVQDGKSVPSPVSRAGEVGIHRPA